MAQSRLQNARARRLLHEVELKVVFRSLLVSNPLSFVITKSAFINMVVICVARWVHTEKERKHCILKLVKLHNRKDCHVVFCFLFNIPSYQIGPLPFGALLLRY